MCSFIIIVVSLTEDAVRVVERVGQAVVGDHEAALRARVVPERRAAEEADRPVLLGAELLARLAGRGAVAVEHLAVPLRLRRGRGPGRLGRIEQHGDVVDAAVDRAALDADDVGHGDAVRRRRRGDRGRRRRAGDVRLEARVGRRRRWPRSSATGRAARTRQPPSTPKFVDAAVLVRYQSLYSVAMLHCASVAAVDRPLAFERRRVADGGDRGRRRADPRSACAESSTGPPIGWLVMTSWAPTMLPSVDFAVIDVGAVLQAGDEAEDAAAGLLARRPT